MSIKRYEWVACDEHACHCDVVESAEGDMVDYEDYAALEQRLIESERYGRQTDITIDNLELKMAQMAAENAALKLEVPMGAIENGRVFADRLEAYPFECQGGNLNMCSDWQELRRCFEHLSEWAMHGQSETPATDDFLAEVRARGVEQLAKAWYAIANETDPGISISESSRLNYRQRADDAADFANEIRQEAAQ